MLPQAFYYICLSKANLLYAANVATRHLLNYIIENMKILVCISIVPDTTMKIRIGGDKKSIDTAGIQWIINPWDELSLTRALDLKESSAGAIKSVTVIHVGPASSEPTLRKALAIGADDAIRVNAEPSDAYFAAAQIAEVISKEKFDVVLCGIESSDYNGSAVGGMIAEFLDFPSVSAVSDIKSDSGTLVLTRGFDGGKEEVTVPAPFVAIVEKGIAKEPRIASMRGIMNARSKTVRIAEPIVIEPLTRIAMFEKPAARPGCRFIDAENPGLLFELLHDEAKVI